MEIKKDFINFVTRLGQVQTRQNQTSGTQGRETIREDQTADATGESLRLRMRGLESELKSLQTEVSNRQVQIAFLDKANPGTDWKGELSRFMQENFRTLTLAPSAQAFDGNLEDYRKKTRTELGDLQNQIIKREVQLQNIISSGMVSDAALITKDSLQSQELFSKLNPGSVANLIRTEDENPS